MRSCKSLKVIRTSRTEFLVSSDHINYNVETGKMALLEPYSYYSTLLHMLFALIAAHPEVEMGFCSHSADNFKTFQYRNCYSGLITVAALCGSGTPTSDYPEQASVYLRQPGGQAK